MRMQLRTALPHAHARFGFMHATYLPPHPALRTLYRTYPPFCVLPHLLPPLPSGSATAADKFGLLWLVYAAHTHAVWFARRAPHTHAHIPHTGSATAVPIRLRYLRLHTRFRHLYGLHAHIARTLHGCTHARLVLWFWFTTRLRRFTWFGYTRTSPHLPHLPGWFTHAFRTACLVGLRIHLPPHRFAAPLVLPGVPIYFPCYAATCLLARTPRAAACIAAALVLPCTCCQLYAGCARCPALLLL